MPCFCQEKCPYHQNGQDNEIQRALMEVSIKYTIPWYHIQFTNTDRDMKHQQEVINYWT